MTPYKDTYAAKGSALHAALQEGDQARAKAIWEATKARYEQLVPADARLYNKRV